jgi:hypothetical protein
MVRITQIALLAALAALTAGAQALTPSAASAFQTECTDWTECGYVDQGDPDGTGGDTSGTPGDGYGMPSDDGDRGDSASTEDPSVDGSDATTEARGGKPGDGPSDEKAKGDLGEKRGSVPAPTGSPFGGELPKRSLGTSPADADNALPVCTVEGLNSPCRARNRFHYNSDETLKQILGPDHPWTAEKFELQMHECRRVQEQAWDLAAVAYIADYFGVTVDLLEFKQKDLQYVWDFEWCDFIYMEPPLP